jgi:hypothetical protein
MGIKVDNYWPNSFASVGSSATPFPVADTTSGVTNYGIGDRVASLIPSYDSVTPKSMGSWWDGARGWGQDVGLLDGPNGPGWGGFAFDLAKSGVNAFMGMKQFGLYEDAMQQARDQFNKNYAAQRATTNGQLEDRQRARIASNPGAYESVDAYMARNGIKA